MRSEPCDHGAARVFGVRYRSFLPWIGLHPTIPAETCITLTLQHPSGEAQQTVLHPWHPSGAPYEGLPRDLHEASLRRIERAVTVPVAAASLPEPREPWNPALTPHCLDLRRLPPQGA
jgi:uncharacterized protein (DUF2126 family)